jgi:hypothetical protein
MSRELYNMHKILEDYISIFCYIPNQISHCSSPKIEIAEVQKAVEYIVIGINLLKRNFRRPQQKQTRTK